MATLTKEQIEEQRARAEKIANASPNGAHPDEDIDLGQLLDEVREFIRRYVVLDAHPVDVLALQTAHTYALDAADVTPYINITSPEKRCGKTLLLEVLSLLGSRSWFTSRVTAAVLIRKIAKETPTLYLDETDATFGGEKEYAEVLRQVLNMGFRRGGVASLCVKAGADFDLRDFPVFCPKILAGIGELPDTLRDRSIRVELKRRAPGEHVERFRRREAEKLAAPIRRRLEAWAVHAIPALSEARPDIPPELDDRASESWEILLSIADAAGETWPERARRAALAMSLGDGREDDSQGVRLLTDIRSVFEEKKAGKLASKTLADALANMEESPWGDMDSKGKRLDQRTLARLLKPYRPPIRPHQIRIGEKTLKGYESIDFADAWKRYCSRISPETETRETSETETSPRYEQPDPDVSDVSDVSPPGGIREGKAAAHG
jgi:Protein of unknown function (DUF3631)